MGLMLFKDGNLGSLVFQDWSSISLQSARQCTVRCACFTIQLQTRRPLLRSSTHSPWAALQKHENGGKECRGIIWLRSLIHLQDGRRSEKSYILSTSSGEILHCCKQQACDMLRDSNHRKEVGTGLWAGPCRKVLEAALTCAYTTIADRQLQRK